MITQNGLNLFKMLLTNSCPDISAFTDIDGNTDYLTSLEATASYYSTYTDLPAGNSTLLSGTFEAASSSFMPFVRNKTQTFNSETTTTNWSTFTNMFQPSLYRNYLSDSEVIITIPAGVNTGQPTQLTVFNSADLIFKNPYVSSNGGSFLSTMSHWYSLAIYGTQPSNLEYFTITIPKCFETYNYISLLNVLGVSSVNLWANLGYSNSAESIDDYDLNSPVFNKKLNPTAMSAKCTDGKIEFTIAFKNFESESISVNELGLYAGYASQYNYQQPNNTRDKISFNGYKVGNYATRHLTLYDNAYTAKGYRPNLIVRKVLPQTITIPPDGIATFKYTIDLSEMKAQENIAYEQV